MNELEIIEIKGQRVLTTKQLAESYETTEKAISNNFNNNIDKYIENKHFYCLTGEELKNFKRKSLNLGIAQNINKFYLWTERGTLLHAKSLNTDKTWQVYDYLIEHYFRYTEEFKPNISILPATAMDIQALETINEAARIILPVVEDVGIEPIHKSYLIKQLYDKAGIEIPMLRVEQPTRLYDKTMIADELGVYSASGKPHSQAIGAIIKKLDIDNSNVVLTSFNRQGHTGVDYQYKPDVLQQVIHWLEDNNYPTAIDGNNKSYKVVYSKVDELV